MISGHTYTILGVSEVTSDGKSQKLVKMRNPWTTENYTGPWSQSDSKWTKESKEQAGLSAEKSQKDEGIFHVPMDLFKKLFGSFAVGMYE